jgi:hypothetical protein
MPALYAFRARHLALIEAAFTPRLARQPSNASSALTASFDGTKWPIQLSDKERSEIGYRTTERRGMRSMENFNE